MTQQLSILIAATAVSVGLSEWYFLPLDSQLLQSLMLVTAPQLSFSVIIGCPVLAIVGFLAAPKLQGLARPLCAVQIWVVALLLSYLGRDLLQIAPLPISYIAAVSIGMFAVIAMQEFQQGNNEEQITSTFVNQLQNKELLEARLELIKQDEIDRRMLAADLHDQVLNDLKTLRQDITNMKDLQAEDLKHLDDLVNRSMSGVREVMDNLSPVDIEHIGLTESLRACLEKAGERGGVDVSFESSAADELDKRLSKIEATLLYRLVQESANNVLKHAGAGKIMGQVKVENGNLVVRIVDDGRGIEPIKFASESRGMRYMRLRADLIGANIAWKSRKSGSGTIVEIQFPADSEDFVSIA